MSTLLVDFKEDKLIWVTSPATGRIYKVYYKNGVYLGDIFAKEDGFYDFWPEYPYKGGYWSSHILREISDKLDEINAPWQKQLDDYMDSGMSGIAIVK